MSIRGKLEEIATHLFSPVQRRRGRTTEMAKAADDLQGYLLVRSLDEVKRLNDITSGRWGAVWWERAGTGMLRGTNRPVLVDPDCVAIMLFAAVDEIKRLEKIVLGATAMPQDRGVHMLIEAALDFVAKVERGEARSTRSYNAFKAALEETKKNAEERR
jgi:hypothetical protein